MFLQRFFEFARGIVAIVFGILGLMFKKKYTPFYIILLIVFVFGSVYLYNHKPTSGNKYLPKCIFHEMTHLYCPGCGVTRAYYSLLHGDFAMAFRYNPMVFPLVTMAVLIAIFPRLSRTNYVIVPLLIVIITFWIVRNLPWYPFTLLAPPPM